MLPANRPDRLLGQLRMTIALALWRLPGLCVFKPMVARTEVADVLRSVVVDIAIDVVTSGVGLTAYLAWARRDGFASS